MFEKFMTSALEIAEAHCDGPCGVYDPSQARVEAESVLQLTKKILDLKAPETGDQKASAAYQNTLTRFIVIKEARAELAKHHLLVLWADYFKPEHLEKYPDLHDKFWKAIKQASECKHHLEPAEAQKLLDMIEDISKIFWETKKA